MLFAGCHVFASCSNGILHDNRPCAANTVWDGSIKRCDYTSSTCPGTCDDDEGNEDNDDNNDHGDHGGHGGRGSSSSSSEGETSKGIKHFT